MNRIFIIAAFCALVAGCDSMVNTTTAANAEITTLPEPVNLHSLRGDVATSLTFINELNISVTINWLDYQGKEVNYATLQPGQAYTQQTYDTHPWVVRESMHNAPVKIIVATPEQTVVKIRPKSVSNSTY